MRRRVLGCHALAFFWGGMYIHLKSTLKGKPTPLRGVTGPKLASCLGVPVTGECPVTSADLYLPRVDRVDAPSFSGPPAPSAPGSLAPAADSLLRFIRISERESRPRPRFGIRCGAGCRCSTLPRPSTSPSAAGAWRGFRTWVKYAPFPPHGTRTSSTEPW